ncbi:MAG: DUF1844 domain-containing protein [Desulfobacterota bacterium]|nr:DUF1844 domain-containing protein [Thermodesulfobacteriota bacterium]
MAEDRVNEEKEKEKGFTVKDRRFAAQREEATSKPQEEKKEKPKVEPSEEKAERGPLPEITFTSFILSLSTSALVQLGEVEDPLTQKQAKNLPLAKQTIDFIGMLKEKTKGNLTPEEERFMDQILFDLRMRYVRAVE